MIQPEQSFLKIGFDKQGTTEERRGMQRPKRYVKLTTIKMRTTVRKITHKVYYSSILNLKIQTSNEMSFWKIDLKAFFFFSTEYE